MIHHEKKKNVLGVMVDEIDYEGAIEYVMRAAKEHKAKSISALAVHGVVAAVLDKEHLYRLNNLDVVLPDGQPLLWALNLLYRSPLSSRCYGPTLTLALCARAEQEGLPVFFYGSTRPMLDDMRRNLLQKFPRLIIAGMEPSRFRRLNAREKAEVVDRIRSSGATMLFVGLGCPKQEIFVYEFRDLLPMPALAVGAAFPMISGEVRQAPLWIRNMGMEFLFRFCTEPRRVWRRHVFHNPVYAALLALQLLRLKSFDPNGASPRSELLYG